MEMYAVTQTSAEEAHEHINAHVVWFARGCKRCAALGMHDLPVDDEAHLLFSCPATAVVRRERRFAQLPFLNYVVAGSHVLS
jgi:hypothetical protein